MKNQIHIMTDIETLGVKSGATIFQVAASAFNIQTGEILDSIDLRLDIEQADLKVDGATLKWWLNTNKQLLQELLTSGTLSERELFTQLGSWVESLKKEGEVVLWGNGILFDNLRIKEKMESLGLTYPIFYRNDRDVRTILALASEKMGLSVADIYEQSKPSDFVHHNASHDVVIQIAAVCLAYTVVNR